LKKAVVKPSAKTKTNGRRPAASIGKRSAASPPGKKQRRRPHGLTLADLFLWITVVDECHYHPRGAFERAASTEGLKSGGNVQQRLLVLEKRFGKLFRNQKRTFILEKRPPEETEGEDEDLYRKIPLKRYRSGVPTDRGAALAEIFVAIEHLYHYALSLGGKESEAKTVIGVKNAIFRRIEEPQIRREFDREIFETGQRRNRITRTQAWSHRLAVRRRLKKPVPKRLSDMPRMRLRYPKDH
jgi:hypothetical protein